MVSGIVLAQEGLDARKAADSQKILDSRWKTLDIFQDVYVDEVVYGVLQKDSGLSLGNAKYSFSHKLGFLPAFESEIIDVTLISGGVNLPSGLATKFYSDVNNIYALIPVDDSYNPISEDTEYSVRLKAKIRIYNLPITEEFKAPAIEATPRGEYRASGIGAKFASLESLGQTMSLTKPEDMSLDTSLKPLSILQHGKVMTPDGLLEIKYSYSRPPLYTVAQMYTGTLPYEHPPDLPLPVVSPMGLSGARGSVRNNVISISGAQAGFYGYYAYILFKDPLDL